MLRLSLDDFYKKQQQQQQILVYVHEAQLAVRLNQTEVREV